MYSVMILRWSISGICILNMLTFVIHFYIDINSMKWNISVMRLNKFFFLARLIITKWNNDGRKELIISNVFTILGSFVFNLYKRNVSHDAPRDP